MKNSPGAIRAAEVIARRAYGDQRKFNTKYGPKTVEGLANIIDQHTAAPDLLEALEAMVATVDRAKGHPVTFHEGMKACSVNLARAAIAKAK